MKTKYRYKKPTLFSGDVDIANAIKETNSINVVETIQTAIDSGGSIVYNRDSNSLVYNINDKSYEPIISDNKILLKEL